MPRAGVISTIQRPHLILDGYERGHANRRNHGPSRYRFRGLCLSIYQRLQAPSSGSQACFLGQGKPSGRMELSSLGLAQHDPPFRPRASLQAADDFRSALYRRIHSAGFGSAGVKRTSMSKTITSAFDHQSRHGSYSAATFPGAFARNAIFRRTISMWLRRL
jgi:hypothetical protein